MQQTATLPAGRAPVAKELIFVGSTKWLEQSPFDRHDRAALHRHRAALTSRLRLRRFADRLAAVSGGLQARQRALFAEDRDDGLSAIRPKTLRQPQTDAWAVDVRA
nr:hypothetical protein [Streptomyces sp. NK08204]